MTNETLAHYANLSLYSAMAVLTLAMLGYAGYLAGLVPARSAATPEEKERERELVGAAAGQAGAGMPSGPDGADVTSGGDAASEIRAGDSAADRERLDAITPLRARKAGAIAGLLSILGTVLLVVAVVLRAISVHRWPLGNMFEFAVFGATMLMIAFCAWGLRRDLRWLGLFVTAPLLLVLGMAITVWYTEAAELMPSLKSVWLAIHVTVATISVALFAIGAALSALYLAQDRVESTGRRSFMNHLPTSTALERLSYGLHIIAFPLWTFTLIAGAIWARQAWGSYWNWDPKEVWTFVIWVVYAAFLHARATSGWKRQSAAYIALAGFVCILINYGVVNVFFVGQHSYSGL
jgi:cytochrome c-type biogenesis protein CcsB